MMWRRRPEPLRSRSVDLDGRHSAASEELAKEVVKLLIPELKKQIHSMVNQLLDGGAPQSQWKGPASKVHFDSTSEPEGKFESETGRQPASRQRRKSRKMPTMKDVDTARAEEMSDWTQRHFRSYNLASIRAQEDERIEEKKALESEPEEPMTTTQGSPRQFGMASLVSRHSQRAPAGHASAYSMLSTEDLSAEGADRSPLRQGRVTRAQRFPLVMAAEYRRLVRSGCTNFWTQMEHMVTSAWFEHFVGIMVVLNAIAIGVETDYQARHMPAPHWLRTLSVLFSLLFTVELSVRIMVNPFRFFDYFRMENFLWNLFDTIVVSFQLLEIMDGDGKLLSGFGLLRVCRVFRILRLVRVVRFFVELRTLVGSMFASLESLFWALLMLLGIIYTFSVALCQLVADGGQTQHADQLSGWFGNIGWSILTMLECITGGVSWSEIITALIIDCGPLTGFFFVVYVMTCLFAVTNAVTAVFVEKITLTAQQDKATYLAQQLRDLFFNGGEEGITVATFKEHLCDPDVQELFKSIDVDPGEADHVFALLDIDGNGELTADELVNGCLRLSGPAQSLDMALIMRQNNLLLKILTKFINSHPDSNFKVRRSTTRAFTLSQSSGLSPLSASTFRSADEAGPDDD